MNFHELAMNRINPFTADIRTNATLCYTADIALLRHYITSKVIHLVVVVTAPSHPCRHASLKGRT